MSTLRNQQPPAFFVRGPSPFARLMFFAALSIALMAVDSRLHYLVEIRQGLTALLHPLEAVARSPIHAWHGVRDYFRTQTSLSNENKALQAQHLQQSADVQRFKALQAENDHLRRMLGVVPMLPRRATMGEIIHSGRDPFSRKVIVNLGSQQGITAGQAVIDEAGVIGQVTRTYPFSAEVTLATDKDLALPVQVERNGLRAIAFGNGREQAMNLPYLPVNVDIREGDKLVTSGMDGIYPAGLAVAIVKRIERKIDSPFAHITCTPTAGIDSHRQVLVIAAPDNLPAFPTESPAAQKPRQSRRHAQR